MTVATDEKCAECEEAEVITADAGDTSRLPSQWHAVLTVEGLRTTDHRAIARDALTWRQLPLPLFAQFLNAGHGDAPIVGQITSITRDGDRVMGEGNFSLNTEFGWQAAQMCADQTLRWGSIDLEVLESQTVEVSVGSSDSGDLMDILFGDDIADTGGTDWYDEVTSGRIMGYTMVATPAFPQAVIAPLDIALDVPEPMGSAPMVSDGLMASSAPTTPPASWFTSPELDEPTPMVVTDDGRVYGHLALWNTCHTGFENSCVVPPKSAQDYAYFRTGRVQCADGEQVRVGQITFNTGHAKATLGWQDTTSHYDHTGSAAADVAVGEDEFGIWFAGALRPGLSPEDIRTVRASALSGDWRKIGGSLELVAALAVNVPGFPIVASIGKRKDEQVSLIAASVKPRDALREMAKEIAMLRAAIRPTLAISREQLRTRMNAPIEQERKAKVLQLKEKVSASVI